MRDEDARIVIDDRGAVTANPAAEEQLSLSRGRYRLIPPTERLLILEREDGVDTTGAGRVVLSGSIDRIGGFVDLLQFIHSNQWNGSLSVLQARTRICKTIQFRRGDVVNATSNVSEDRIGAILYRFGMITEKQLESALAACTPPTRLGQMFVEQNVLTAHDLFNYVRKQAEEIFFSVLSIADGDFFFSRDASEDDAAPSQLQLPMRELLFQGISRIDELSYFREKLPSSDIVLVRREPQPSASPASRDPLGDKERKVLELVDGHRTLAELARESHLGEFQTTKIVYQLLQADYLQRQSAGGAAPPRSANEGYEELVLAFNRAYARIFTAVASRGKQDSLVARVGSFLASEEESGPLFRGVALEPDGTVAFAPLLANLSDHPIGDKHEFLRDALNELLFFELFFAGETVDRQDVAFQQALHHIRRDGKLQR